jgi:hypothetical protein
MLCVSEKEGERLEGNKGKEKRRTINYDTKEIIAR